MESKVSKLEEEYKKRIIYISSHLEDLYETIVELEQNRDLCELRSRALKELVIVPLLGFLEKYDFDSDESLVVVETGILKIDKLENTEDLKKAQIVLGDEKKDFSKSDSKIFMVSFDIDELEQFKEGKHYEIPIVQVKTVEDKEVFSDSSSDEDDDEEEVEKEED
ncbi:Hypothetical protein ZAZAV_538 [Cedratvirus Zaza IHUMI]|uniref:Uncharacterized protein n=1 Tax=Cedratvirus Zaza IHUMI TaxID=2126979 RepID=A0A2R8FFR5_9VIRU|nr:Hypothetical protein ZAZAV_538 [Cedratvirus Zaza IHUMI]